MAEPKAITTWEEFSSAYQTWVEANFPNTPSYRPLLGIVEEIGELRDAHIENNDALIKDSIGDTLVYAHHYATIMEFNLHAAIELGPLTRFKDLTILIGKLAHCHLKYEQGIRQITKAEVELTYAALIRGLNTFAMVRSLDLFSVLFETFTQVQKRNWAKHKTDGGVV